MDSTKPVFIETDPEAVLAAVIADYEARAGKTLLPAQAETLVLNSIAYRETLLRASIQSAGEQNLVAFSSAPVLDYLGELVGVTRLAAAFAECTVRFTMVTGHGGVTIPQGFQVATTDNQVVFETKAATVVASGVDTVDAEVVAKVAGASGNGYAIGTITGLPSPVPYIDSATNTNETSGGADQETDEALRTRIKLAPASFSTAGSKGAYQYWAKTANAGILDVEVVSPSGGLVNIYPMMEDGSETSPAVLSQVLEACNDDQVRPLTDTVSAIAPTRVQVDLEIQYRAVAGNVQADIEAAMTANLTQYFIDKRQSLGNDIVDDQIVAAAMVSGVYDVTLVGFSTVVIASTSFAFLGTLTINWTADV